MFALWCLLLWGTLFDLSLLFTVVTRGAEAAAHLLFAPPVENTAAAWGNRLCGLLALIGWVLVVGGRWSSPRKAA